MTSVDSPLATVDRNRPKIYLQPDNLARPFKAFTFSHYEARISEDPQQNGIQVRAKVLEGPNAKQVFPEHWNGKPSLSNMPATTSQQNYAQSAPRPIQYDVEKVRGYPMQVMEAVLSSPTAISSWQCGQPSSSIYGASRRKTVLAILKAMQACHHHLIQVPFQIMPTATVKVCR